MWTYFGSGNEKTNSLLNKNSIFAPSKVGRNEAIQIQDSVILIGNLSADVVAVVVSCPCLSIG